MNIELISDFIGLPAWGWSNWAWLILSAFVASYVRSFAGFGAALVAVPAFVLIMPPQDAVPLAMAMDICVGLMLLPQVLNTGIAWPSIRLLLLPALLLMPVGGVLLKIFSAKVLYLMIAAVVFVSACLLAAGYRSKKDHGAWTTIGAGALSGLLGGAFGMTGPPVVILYFSSPMAKDISRATMMAYFIVTTAAYLVFSGVSRLSLEWLSPLSVMLPFIVVATWMGNKKFLKTDEKHFRVFAYGLLFFLSICVAVKGF